MISVPSSTPLIASAALVVCCLAAGCSSQTELEWEAGDGYRWAEVDPGFFGRTGFEIIPSARTGIEFRNDVRTELVEKNRHYLGGSGVATGDVDGDGLVDVYFARLDGPNKLYRNRGDFRFEDVTVKAGVAHEGYNSTGVAFADVEGDGDIDLLVTSLDSANVLYLNDGQGRFEMKKDSGLGPSNGAMSMALGDVDGDGLLDLYITNYKTRTVRDLYGPRDLALENTVEEVDGELRLVPPFDQYYGIIETEGQAYRNEYGEKDELYMNRGEAVFERVDDTHYFTNDEFGPGLRRDWGLTATFRDVTGDLRPDLYVANDFWTPDRLWINRGDGTFRASSPHAIRDMSFSSMGVDFSDINRDGLVDFAVTEMLSSDHGLRMRQYSEHLEEYEGSVQHNRNSLYLNRGDTTFAQIAYYAGLEASEWSWSTIFTDVDLDGYEDLIVATGFGYDYQDMDTQLAMDAVDRGSVGRGGDILEYPSLTLRNKAFRNNGDLTFSDVSEEWGFEVEDLSMGVAPADLDNDGVLDLVVNRMNDEAAVYRNRTNAARIAVRLHGERPNTHGIGAVVEIEGGPVRQSKEIVAGGNYLSSGQPQAVFAAEGERTDHVITVRWPSGKRSRIEGVAANRIYAIEEAAAADLPVEFDSARGDGRGGRHRNETALNAPTPLFRDISEQIGHRHHENDYDDFRFHPLQPLKLSRLGPGAAWLDVNADDREDLLVGSGKGGRLAIFESGGDRGLAPIEMEPLTRTAPGDQTALVGWKENGSTIVSVGSANFEQGDPGVASAYVYRIDPDGFVSTDSLPGILSTTGPLAAADYTGDGRIDLFVGGRFKPGQYPRDAASRLFRNTDSGMQLDAASSTAFAEAGLVTGAVFSDFDQDGDQDLLVSTEWGKLRLFSNDRGRFTEITDDAGLGEYPGWWNGVATGDFNNDGLPDIVATNMGLNSAYQTDPGHALRMYYGDFNRDGRLDVVESYYDEAVEGYVPRRKLIDFVSIPTVLRQVGSHEEYGKSNVDELFGIDDRTPRKEINTLAHMLFINTGAGFEARQLPPEAQFSAAFFAGVADFDNDGNEDLFLSQNFFAFPVGTPRLDSGRGLLLRGDGRGNLTPVAASESGLKIYGEQRGAALTDFDRDGRVDLAVSQNDGQTKIYINETDTAGLRIRLVGPAANEYAFGSSVRLVYADGTKGPRREIQAGSGYWSQNGHVQVMGASGDPREIEIVWFDGRAESVPVSVGQKEYAITYHGLDS